MKFFSKTGKFLPLEVDTRTCPMCKVHYLDRVPRRFIDRLISVFTQVKRYSCEYCKWEGNLKID